MRGKDFRKTYVLLHLVILSLLVSCTPNEPIDFGDREIVTIFATAGDLPTEVDLAASISRVADFELLNQPESAALFGSVLTLDHSDPVHEGVRVSVTRGGRKVETLVVWHAVQPRTAPRWPLSVSESRRYLVDSMNSPQIWTGTSAWSLAVVPDRSDVTLYLADRSEKRVNVVLVQLIDHLFSDQQPPWLNYYRHSPFASTLRRGVLDFSTPDEKYWRHVDWVLREAYRYGITVLGAPAYIGYKLGNQGWANHMMVNGKHRLRQYGEWLGRRYRNYPNLVWVMGGDWGTRFEDKVVNDEVDAIAEGIKSFDSVHLMTAHSQRNRSAVDDYNRDWLDINSSYSDEATVHTRVQIDYQRSPVVPTFLIEGRYANERGVTEQRIRAQMYNALLGGAFGQFYGNAPQWYFSAKSVDFFADEKGLDWRDRLNSFGAQSIPLVASLAHEFNLLDLVPDLEHKILTSGFGDEGADYAPLAYGPGLAIAYLPEQREITVNTTVFVDTVKAKWRNPVNGLETQIGHLLHGDRVFLIPPAPGDWVLILEANSQPDHAIP